jgi:hypothetical protein
MVLLHFLLKFENIFLAYLIHYIKKYTYRNNQNRKKKKHVYACMGINS